MTSSGSGRRKIDYIGGSKARRLPKTLSREELTLLMKRPNVNCPTGLRNRAMLELMYSCGLRVGDICGLYLRDVRWAEGKLHIRPEVGKGGREAFVTLDDVALEWLERWKAIRRKYAAGKPWLFVTLRAGPIDPHYVWEMVGRYARKAGIERHVHPHMLRHTYATELLNDGFNIAEVQKLMRHSDIRTTSIYLHVRDAELDAKVRARRSANE